MLKMLPLALRIYQIAAFCCIFLGNVDFAKEKKKGEVGEGSKNPCVGKKTNCQQRCWRLCSKAALSTGLLKEKRQKAGLLTLVSMWHGEIDMAERWKQDLSRSVHFNPLFLFRTLRLFCNVQGLLHMCIHQPILFHTGTFSRQMKFFLNWLWPCNKRAESMMIPRPCLKPDIYIHTANNSCPTVYKTGSHQ